MSWALIPYCGPGAVPASFWADWNLDPWLLAGLLGLAAARLGLRRSAMDRADAAYAGGWLGLVIAFVSPLCALSAALFSARIAHHLLLVAVAAPLLAFAWRAPVERWTRAGLPLVPLACLHVGLFWLWHAPLPYAAAMAQHGLYWLMEASLLTTAVLFWLAVLDRRAALVAIVPTVIGVMAQMGFLGALLAFAGRPLYAPHSLTTWPWGLTPLEDQVLAGLIMWVPGALPYLIVLLAVLASRLAGRRAVEGDAASGREHG